MHTLNLPPGQLLRAALLALLLTILVMVLVAAVRPAALDLGASGGGSDASAPTQPVTSGSGAPAWATDPLTPPLARPAE